MGTYIRCKKCEFTLPCQSKRNLEENETKWERHGCPQCNVKDQFYTE